MAFSRRISRLPTRLKVTYTLISLVVLASLAVFIWAAITGKIKPFAAAPEASLSVSGSTSSVNVGEVFSLYIYLYTDGGTGISAVNIKSLNFDNTKLEVQSVQITPDSTNDWQVTENSTDQATGKINYSLTALDPTNGFIGSSSRLGIVNFKAEAAGQANLWFDYSSSLGDSDVIAKDSGNDILTLPTLSFVTINGPETPTPENSPTPPTSRSSTGPTQCLKGCSPTPVPVSAAPTAEETLSLESPTPTELTVAPTGVPEVVALNSPTPSESPNLSISPSFLPGGLLISPSASAVTKLAGFSISPTIALVLYIGVPVLIVLIIFLIWWWRKKKKLPAEGGETGSEESFTNDDEEI